MNKRLLIGLAFCVSILFPAQAHAHVLIKDQVQGTGAILHLNPDDDPIAGERATLFFDIRDASIAQGGSTSTLVITDGKNTTAKVPSQIHGTGVSAHYVFPRQGLYNIELAIQKEGEKTHTFSHQQRVSRGIIGAESAYTAPAWAEAGIVFTMILFVFEAIIIFNRRKAISEYSKW